MINRCSSCLLAAAAIVGIGFVAAARQPEAPKAPPAPPADAPKAPAQPGDPMRGPRMEPPAGGQPGQPGRREGRGGGGEMNVEGAMKTMNRNLKALRSTLNDAAKKDESLRLIGEMQRAAIAAKNAAVPNIVTSKAKNDDEKAAAKLAYRVNLIAVARKLLDAEQAVLDGKTDDAKAAIKALEELEEKGHKEANVEE